MTKIPSSDSGIEDVGHTLWDPDQIIEAMGGSPPLTYNMLLVSKVLGFLEYTEAGKFTHICIVHIFIIFKYLTSVNLVSWFVARFPLTLLYFFIAGFFTEF